MNNGFPKWIWQVFIVLAAVMMLLAALAYRDRMTKSPNPGLQLIPDMDRQIKFKSQSENELFADTRSMRKPVDGTIAIGELREDDHFFRGKVNGEWATSFPIPINEENIRRGKERFEIYCTPCHGYTGAGNGINSFRAEELEEGTWVPPPSFHIDRLREKPVGEIFNIVTHGIRNMASYGGQIPEDDRWKIIMYLRVLQMSQNVPVDDIPNEFRRKLELEKPEIEEAEIEKPETEEPEIKEPETTENQ